ncbi:MAG: NFACT RNA binding domain-containing protein [Armatimonadota bacterium]|nr:NFACT RNA binding domain-containing protein [Armatimonadota bacterium]
MTYDGLLLAGAAAELRSALIGGRVSKVRQPEATQLILVIRNRGADFRLLLSIDAQFPRAHLTASVPPSPPNPFGFCMALRKHIQESVIAAIEQPGFDRILVLQFTSPDGGRARLIHEIMGKHSNLVLVNDEGRILAAAKVVTAAISRQRQTVPGRDYVPPPSNKVDPLCVTPEEFKTLVGSDQISGLPRDWLVRTFTGVGPFLGAELAARSGDQPNPDTLWNELTWLRETVSSAKYSPVAVTDERGKIELIYPVPTVQCPAERQFARASLNEALDVYYRVVVGSAALESERGRLRASLQRAISAREKSVEGLRQAIADGSKAEQYKIMGELLTAHTGEIAKGSAVVALVNYYDPSLATIDIPLEPELSPRENVERYFKRFQKARDSAAAAADRLAESDAELQELRAALSVAETLDTVDALREMRRRLTERGLVRHGQAPQLRGKLVEQPFKGMRIRRLTSSDGWEILVGENSLANDYLTTKVASPNDLWFHARSVKGAHVVVRTNNRPQNVSPGAIRHAAELAASGSDAKHSSLVPVDYTLRKYVRKPRGSAPGYVTYQNEKTLDVTPAK